MDPRWQHPFTCMVAGPTSCGKTEWVKKFVRHLSRMMVPIPQDIVWYYGGAWQKGYEDLRDFGVRFEEGLPDIETLKNVNDKRRLLILDDLMHDADARIVQLFTKGSHHQNTSVMYLVQNVFDRHKDHRTISLNSHYMVLFKNPRDATQVRVLAQQMYPGEEKYFKDSFKEATSVPYGYLVVDLRQDTPDHLRLRTGLFNKLGQFVYVQK